MIIIIIIIIRHTSTGSASIAILFEAMVPELTSSGVSQPAEEERRIARDCSFPCAMSVTPSDDAHLAGEELRRARDRNDRRGAGYSYARPRLVNAPLHPAVVSVKRIRAVRAATTSYCMMLYERAYELLEHREHIRALRTQFKANFERDAALIRRRVKTHLSMIPETMASLDSSHSLSSWTCQGAKKML